MKSRDLIVRAALVAALLAGGAASPVGAAQPSANPGVAALVRQGDFWSQKGRKDLAADAYRRALAAEPSNAAARAGLAALTSPSATMSGAQGGNLARARTLASRGEAGAAAAAYRQAFGGATPPDAVALEYYQTLAGAPGGQAEAQAGLRALAARRPGDAEAQLALGQVLTYREGVRREGIALLAKLAGGGGPTGARATAAWRQALIWMDAAPRNAGLFNDYLASHAGDAEIARKLADANRPLPAAPAADPNAKTRAEGFAALERGDLPTAESRFQTAIARRANDADALGGLGLVRLRGQRFTEAAGLLDRASRAKPAAAGRWKQALMSARFYSGLQQAQASLDQGRTTEAERILRPLAGPAYPEHDMAQGLLAESLRRQGKATEAEALYREILAARPDRLEAQQGLVQVLLDQNRSAEAQALAARSAAFTPDANGQNAARGRLDHDRANRLWAAGDLSGANTAFESALAAAPADPWIRLDFARFLAGQGEIASAQGLMAPVATGATPDQIQAAALFIDQQGHPAEALALISRLPPAKVTPALATLRTRLEVDAVIDQARRGGGTAYLRTVAASPDLPIEASGRIALALYDLGDQQMALVLAQQALVSGVTEPPASYDGAVSVLARAGHDAEAAALIRQAAVRAGTTPQGVEAVANLTASLGAERADRLRQAGDLASAFDVLSAAFAIAPRSIRLLPPLGRLYQDGHLYDQAIQTYGVLVRTRPGDQEGLTGLAGALAAKGDVAGARRTLAQALAAAPDDADLYLLSARIERQAGDEAAALQALRKARALRQQPIVGGGLDAVLAPGAAMGGGLGPNPFSSDRSSAIPIAASRTNLLNSSPASGLAVAPNPWSPSLVAAPIASAYIAPGPGGVAPYAGEAFPLTGRDGRSAVSDPAPRPYLSSVASNPFILSPGGDPLVDDIDRQIAELTAKTAAEVSGSAKVRTRSGEAGLSRLDELSGQAAITFPAGRARFTASASPVTIDAGTPGGDAEQRLGSNQILNARAIVGAFAPLYPMSGTQSASGAAPSLAVKVGNFAADIGTTPIGFKTVDATGGASWSPRLGRSGQGRLWVERRPVTDSVIAYAGTRDPVTGRLYGQVMRTGGGASLSYDDGASGLYGDASYYRYEGRHVLDNDSYQVNFGGYFRPYRRGETQVQVGFNLNQQGYDNDQNYFSLGHGGYFSPKSFTSLTAPVSISAHLGDWRLRGEFAPGYQTYNQAGAAYFPLDAALQNELNRLATANTDVFARYRPQSASGFGAAGNLSGEYLFRPGTTLGGLLNFNTFGDYNETSISVSVRQTLGEGTAP